MIKSKFLFLTLFILFPSVSLSIVNGERIPNKYFPSVVKLGGCTGSYIHHKIILTAAHCRKAVLRSLDLKKFVPHPLFRRRGRSFDVALAILNEPTHKPLSKISFTSLYPGDPVIMVGFGRSLPGGVSGGIAGQKRWGENSIFRVKNGLYLIKNHYDSGNFSDANTAPGDSGGPIFNTDYEIIGITQGLFRKSPYNPTMRIIGQVKLNRPYIKRFIQRWLAKVEE